MENEFRCVDCGLVKSRAKDGIGTGYGINRHDFATCYACCGKRDEAEMVETGKAVLYLVKRDGKDFVTNWPSSLNIPASVQRSRHNIARYRYDAWFTFKGQKWHGVQYGDNTQIIHCKRIAA